MPSSCRTSHSLDILHGWNCVRHETAISQAIPPLWAVRPFPLNKKRPNLAGPGCRPGLSLFRVGCIGCIGCADCVGHGALCSRRRLTLFCQKDPDPNPQKNKADGCPSALLLKEEKNDYGGIHLAVALNPLDR